MLMLGLAMAILVLMLMLLLLVVEGLLLLLKLPRRLIVTVAWPNDGRVPLHLSYTGQSPSRQA